MQLSGTCRTLPAGRRGRLPLAASVHAHRRASHPNPLLAPAPVTITKAVGRRADQEVKEEEYELGEEEDYDEGEDEDDEGGEYEVCGPFMRHLYGQIASSSTKLCDVSATPTSA